ncbi:MAG: PDZ domain-containing protein [Pseudohongiella sp.]|nr:PDZ domain-containing protein [Pseudohongiella sp.]
MLSQLKTVEGWAVLEFEGKVALIKDNTLIDSPLYRAGLDRGDQILALDRLSIESQAQWTDAIERYQPSDTATIRYLQRGVERSVEIRFEQDQQLEVVSYESADREVSNAQMDLRKAGWESIATISNRVIDRSRQ